MGFIERRLKLDGALGDQDRVRLLVFGFSKLLELRKRGSNDVGFEVLTVQQVFLRFIFEGRQYPVKGLLQINKHRNGTRVYTDINDGNGRDLNLDGSPNYKGDDFGLLKSAVANMLIPASVCTVSV